MVASGRHWPPARDQARRVIGSPALQPSLPNRLFDFPSLTSCLYSHHLNHLNLYSNPFPQLSIRHTAKNPIDTLPVPIIAAAIREFTVNRSIRCKLFTH